jgi:peptidoglycan hydrolase CwlO-like protein
MKGRQRVNISRAVLHVLLVAALGLAPVPRSSATLPVIDAANIAMSQTNWAIDHTMKTTFHTADIAKYVEQIDNQVRQIVNQYTQIANQVENLRRLGDPNYYINMLHLNTILGEVQKVEGTIGGTISQFRGMANGVASLKYTADGIYSDLSKWTDMAGNPIQYSQPAFRKYGLVFDMYDAYDKEMSRYQDSMTNLQHDFTDTVQQLNGASSQIERETLIGKLHAIQTQMDVAKNRIQIAADRVKVQQQVNQADQARTQEALREQELQNMAIQNQETIDAGTQSQASFPKVSDLGPLNLGY